MLTVKNLKVAFKTRRGVVDAVKGVSFELAKGERLGIVGESGSGKSVTSYALMRILDAGGKITAGNVVYSGIDIRRAAERDMQNLRGREIGMIFQNPRAALNPIRKVGKQIEDVLLCHHRATHYNAREKAIEALKAVKIHDAEKRYDAYPFELSGGMCQRVVIAIALACDPLLMICDEPTTGLDITTQKAVMDLVDELVVEHKMSSILITHDLGLAAQYCDRIVVMKDGLIVEEGAPNVIFSQPTNAYTRKLVDATPRPGISIREILPVEERKPLAPRVRHEETLLSVENLVKTYHSKSGEVQAVKGISFDIKSGESMGLVGESGCGKSTTSSMIVRLLDPTSGKIVFKGQDLSLLPAKTFARNPLRSKIQMVFQDATDSLDPRQNVRQALIEPLMRLSGVTVDEANSRVEELARLTALPVHLLDRLPHQLSGGQKARVGIARAIAPGPELLILDEPTAALDVSIQAVVLNLLADLRSELNMSYLFVSHNLGVVRLLCDRVVVMKAGEIVEKGVAETVMENPSHPYTRELLEAAPYYDKNEFD